MDGHQDTNYMNNYYTSFKNQFRALRFLLVIIALSLLYLFWIIKRNELRDYTINFFSIFILIELIPVLYLHLEYFYLNSNTTLNIDYINREITFSNKAIINETFRFDDLEKIEVFMPPVWHRKSNFQVLAFEQYHYAIIYTKTGKKIIFTCLMAQKVEDAVRNIRGVPIDLKKRLFASVLIG